MFLYGSKKSFESDEILVEDRINLFEVKIPVDMNQDIAKSRQSRKVSCERFGKDPAFPEDLKRFPVTCRPPQSLFCDQIGRDIDRRLDPDHHRMIVQGRVIRDLMVIGEAVKLIP